MQNLFVKDIPSLVGFPTSLLPNPVALVLVEAGFRVVSRMDERRIWMEYSGIEVGEGTPERPDWGMEHFSLMLEAGVHGMHIMKHILRMNRLPYSGAVYSGKVPTDERFMKQLLANCIWPDSHVTIDEERVAEAIRHDLEDIFDVPVEVNCLWFPVQKQVEIYATATGQSTIKVELDDTVDVIKTSITTLAKTLSRWLPEATA